MHTSTSIIFLNKSEKNTDSIIKKKTEEIKKLKQTK